MGTLALGIRSLPFSAFFFSLYNICRINMRGNTKKQFYNGGRFLGGTGTVERFR